MTSSFDAEVDNARKCLAACSQDGALLFHHVAVISLRKVFLKRLKAALGKLLEPDELDRVGFYAPEDFCSFLAEEPPAKEQTVAGYKVKVNVRKSTDGVARKKALAEVILKSLKKLKGKPE